MSDLSSNPLALAQLASTTLIPMAVLVAAFVGSLHCVAMCGGLVLAAAPTKTATAAYQLGRLLGYGVLGAVAGLFGEKALKASMYGVASWLAAVTIGLTFIYIGVTSYRSGTVFLKPFRLPPRLQSAVSRLYTKTWGALLTLPGQRTALSKSLAVGAMSVFLPCGWLYGFALGAATTQSAIRGAIFLTLFWLGTLPALSLAPSLLQRILKPIAARVPKAVGVVFVVVGLTTMALKAAPLVTGKSRVHGVSNSKNNVKGEANEMPADCPMHRKSHH